MLVVMLLSFLGVTAALLTTRPPSAPAQEPSMTIAAISFSFACSDEYLVVGEDYVKFEVIVSGNNSDYTHDVFARPSFRREDLVTTENGKTDFKGDRPVCDPYEKGDKDSTTKCSVKEVGPQVYRFKLFHVIKFVNESRGRLILEWPSIRGDLKRFCHLPEVRESSQEKRDSEKLSSGSIVGIALGIIIGFIIIIILLVVCVAHQKGRVHCFTDAASQEITGERSEDEIQLEGASVQVTTRETYGDTALERNENEKLKRTKDPGHDSLANDLSEDDRSIEVPADANSCIEITANSPSPDNKTLWRDSGPGKDWSRV